ncbi:MAG: hypothetical protein AAGJ18_18585, partial [Bacteroidota bacterium]
PPLEGARGRISVYYSVQKYTPSLLRQPPFVMSKERISGIVENTNHRTLKVVGSVSLLVGFHLKYFLLQ